MDASRAASRAPEADRPAATASATQTEAARIGTIVSASGFADMINDDTEQQLLKRAIIREIGRALGHMFEIEHKAVPANIRQLLEKLEQPGKADNSSIE